MPRVDVFLGGTQGYSNVEYKETCGGIEVTEIGPNNFSIPVSEGQRFRSPEELNNHLNGLLSMPEYIHKDRDE